MTDKEFIEGDLNKPSPAPIKTGYHKQTTKPKVRPSRSRPPIKYHLCQPRVKPDMNHPYPYCQICGRVMSNLPIAKLRALAELAKVELTVEQQSVMGIQSLTSV